MVEGPVDTPFQQGEVGFHGVGRNITARKFLSVMPDGLMAAGKCAANSPVSQPIIGHYPGIFMDNFFDSTVANF